MSDQPTPNTSASPRTRLTAWSHRLYAMPDATGVVVATWFFAGSLAPSLLLRTWLFQGVLTGVSVAVGYWLGQGAAALWRWGWSRSRWSSFPSAHVEARIRLVAVVASLVFALYSAVRAVPQHEWTWQRLGHEPESFWYVYPAVILLGALIAAALFVIGWLLARLWRRLTRAGTRMLPAWLAGGLALVVLVWAITASVNDFVLQRTLDGANATFAASDRSLDRAPDPSTSALRSGGPESEVDWAATGHEGRRFLTRGPSVADLADFSEGPATEPVRVFVGRAQDDDLDARVALAVDELERFGGFERDALLVVIPTGTGWVNEQLVQPLEYFYEGDIATVALQYSHLPSPLAFLAETEAAGDTGRALVAAVEERLADLSDPPALYIAGESLGSFGGAQAFNSLEDSATRTAGALWVGPPETMHLRREAEKRRNPGSLQIRPIVGDGATFAFINRSNDFAALSVQDPPHSIFLQQADDPIVWWDWETAYGEPDWLQEPLDPAVNPDLRWTPLTTFLQLAVDMAVSNDFDEEHGHLYGTLPLTSWWHIVGPEGWTPTKLAQLRERLTEISR